MLCREGSRSTLELLLAGFAVLAFASAAVAQAPATPVPAPPSAQSSLVPPATTQLPTLPETAPPSSSLPPLPPAESANNSQASEESPDTGTVFAYNLASVPDMIGDTPLGARYILYALTPGTPVTIPIAGGDGYAKIADDNSPLPQDRVFFDDNYFNHAVLSGNGSIIDLNRITTGFEKTFFNGYCSIQVQLPIDNGLNSVQNVDYETCFNQGTELGNLCLTLKCLLYRSESLAISIGAMLDLPTAPDGSFTFDGSTLLIRNHSVHVAPFLGVLYAPTPNFFAMGYVQADFDTNGDPVTFDFGSSDPDGTVRDPSFLYLDLAAGYWLFRDSAMAGRYLTGIAPTVELHYSTTMGSYQPVDEGLFPLYGGLDELELTAGVHCQLGPRSMFTLAAAVPLRSDYRDREFDSEMIAELDRRF
jgi:hypothetical protein